jgi:hypothetical protein
MMSDDEMMEIIENKLQDPLGDLWDCLSPEERKEVFSRLIIEYLGDNW